MKQMINEEENDMSTVYPCPYLDEQLVEIQNHLLPGKLNLVFK